MIIVNKIIKYKLFQNKAVIYIIYCINILLFVTFLINLVLLLYFELTLYLIIMIVYPLIFIFTGTLLSQLKSEYKIEINFKLPRDRKSTRLNSSHVSISYAVFCL